MREDNSQAMGNKNGMASEQNDSPMATEQNASQIDSRVGSQNGSHNNSQIDPHNDSQTDSQIAENSSQNSSQMVSQNEVQQVPSEEGDSMQRLIDVMAKDSSNNWGSGMQNEALHRMRANRSRNASSSNGKQRPTIERISSGEFKLSALYADVDTDEKNGSAHLSANSSANPSANSSVNSSANPSANSSSDLNDDSESTTNPNDSSKEPQRRNSMFATTMRLDSYFHKPQHISAENSSASNASATGDDSENASQDSKPKGRCSNDTPRKDDDTKLAPRYHRYLPNILRESYALETEWPRHIRGRPEKLPEFLDLRGSVLILDLSGFTAFGERLKKELGDREGAAEFANRVNTILSTMVELVYEFGGDVLMFAGDALICFFEERADKKSNKSDDTVSMESATRTRVQDCCLRILGDDRVGGDRDFTIHGGAAHGLVRSFFLGKSSATPGDCTFVISGLPLRHAGRLLTKSGRGEVLIDGLEDALTEEEGKLFLQKTPALSHAPEEEPKNGNNAGPLVFGGDFDVHPHARAYVGTLAARRSDHAENAMSILLNELRPVAIVFVGLHDLMDNMDSMDAASLELMNESFISLSRITHSCNGVVKEMIFDDKSCVFIAVFGAHSHEVNNSFDATVCAMRMQNALIDLKMNCFSLGVSFGDCFCGGVGPKMRGDYVVMGTEVNMAARLMGKAPNQGTLVSKRIYSNSKKYIKFMKSEKIQVKGKGGLFFAYIPQSRIVQSNIFDDVAGNQRPFIQMPSREMETRKILQALDRAADGQPGVVSVCGGPFLGKSKIIQHVSEKAQTKNFTVLQSFRTSLDSFTSYFPFRQITLSALQHCFKNLLGAETESMGDENFIIEQLIENEILHKTDKVIIGSILPTVTDSQLITLLKGQNPKAMTKTIIDSLMKILQPLQPVMLVFEGDGEIDLSSWSLIAGLMERAVQECPRLLVVISSRNVPILPPDVEALQSKILQVKLSAFEKYETEIYLKELLGIRNKGIGVDRKLLDAIHFRANGCALFIEYIVTWALDKGMIEHVVSKNVMSFKPSDEHSEDATTAIPRELSNIVLAAFNNLSPVLWDALKIASCIGYSFDAGIYEALNGDLDFIPKINELATSYSAFEMSDGNRFKWKHQAVYEAVKSLLVNNQRVQIHIMIVEVFEKNKMTGSNPNPKLVKGDVHRLLARHCSLAEKWDLAFIQYMEAGKSAEETFNFTEASKMYEEAIACQQEMELKPVLRWQFLAKVKLGSCLRELARYRESEEVLTQCLNTAQAAMTKSDGDQQMYVHALTALATLHQAQSKYNEARELYIRALPIARNFQVSRSSLWLAGHIAGYAEILRKSGDLVSAEELHREALEIRELAASENTCTELELAVSYTQLGCTLIGRKQYEEGYRQHHMALFSRFKYLNFSHGLVSESLNYCAEALSALGRSEEGISLGMHAVQIRKIVFGTSHPAYAHALSILASCYHKVGRSNCAKGLLEECLGICEATFPQNHANLIPNLMNYADVLCSTGDFKMAHDVYERAIMIHKINFKENQKANQLEKCQTEVKELTLRIESGEDIKHTNGAPVASDNIMCVLPEEETRVIVITDIGRDVDDEYALVLAGALRKNKCFNPIAVVTTLSPSKQRAYLARGVLDTVGLPDVPVGVGSAGGVSEGVELEVYPADYAATQTCGFESGEDLMKRALKSSPDKSVELLILASLTDAAILVRNHEHLFMSKVKGAIIMGGLNPLDSAEFIEPDTSYNNNCDMEAAKYFYQRCQELGMPTITLSRYAAYGCPIPTAIFNDLSKTEHMVATNLRGVSKSSVNHLWFKVNLQKSDPRREKLPERCNRRWFCETFLGVDDVAEKGTLSIWNMVQNLKMYDPLAMLCCVPAFREKHFKCETKYVNGTAHKLIGKCATQSGIVDADALCKELCFLLEYSFRSSLQNADKNPK